MAHYRKKPVVIEAFRFGYDPRPDWFDVDDVNIKMPVADVVYVRTIEGDMKARFGDWIIKGVAGEIYPCRNDIFMATYEPAHPVGLP